MEIRAFRWYGGKLRVVNELRFLIPPHKAYYEPFMGSAALLLNHQRSELEVANDLDRELVHFMKTLADREKGRALVERLPKLWFDRASFDEAMEHKKHGYRGLDDIEKSAMIFTLVSQSFNGERKSFSKQAFKDTNDFRQSIMLHIPKVYERLEGVHILNMDGIDVLARIADNENAFGFVDPPYRHNLRGVGADKAYACELPHSEQVRLLKTIRHAKCKIILCGYRNENGRDLYSTYLLPHGWKCYLLKELAKNSQLKAKRDMGREFIWVNYELPDIAKYVMSMRTYG